MKGATHNILDEGQRYSDEKENENFNKKFQSLVTMENTLNDHILLYLMLIIRMEDPCFIREDVNKSWKPLITEEQMALMRYLIGCS